ncbi:MAG: DUF2125 domain-containing protein [Pseudomonadota bacterium]
MRLLFVVVLIFSAGWSGYWYVGATVQKSAIETWLDDQTGRSPRVRAGQVTTTGYPNRFDIILTELAVEEPAAWQWQTPELRIYALSYQPNRIIATLPPAQTLSLGTEEVRIATSRLAASVHFGPTLSLPLRESIFETADLALTSADWEATLARAQFSVRESPQEAAPPNAYDVAIDVDDLRLPRQLLAEIDPGGRLPETLSAIEARLTPVFDSPWDRFAAEGAPPELTSVEIERATLAWGQIRIEASGDLDVDRLGRADGRLRVSATNWREMLSLAEDAALIEPDQTRAISRALDLLARTSGSPDTLNIPLAFSGGRTRIGPIPIGPAPQLVYRQ